MTIAGKSQIYIGCTSTQMVGFCHCHSLIFGGVLGRPRKLVAPNMPWFCHRVYLIERFIFPCSSWHFDLKIISYRSYAQKVSWSVGVIRLNFGMKIFVSQKPFFVNPTPESATFLPTSQSFGD